MKAYVVEKDVLVKNIETLKRKAANTPIWAVLKGNGYGLGVVPMAKILAEQEIHRFAVTDLKEVRALRESGFVDEQILMLRGTADPDEINELMDLDVIFTIGSYEDAVAINGIAGQRATVAEAHLKIDTGMGRYGFLPSEVDKAISLYEFMKNIAISGIYTHFHSAFCNKKVTRAQYELFTEIVGRIQNAGYETGMVHCCNSSAFLKYPEMYCDAVRLGSAFLGRMSFPTKLKRVGYAETAIEELRWLPKGHTEGYGAAWRAKEPTKVAILGIGWYHGFGAQKGEDLFRFRDCVRNMLSWFKTIFQGKSLCVTIHGKKCKVLGHVGMVHTAVDVTHVDCKLGDKAILQINPLLVKGMKIQYR